MVPAVRADSGVSLAERVRGLPILEGEACGAIGRR